MLNHCRTENARKNFEFLRKMGFHISMVDWSQTAYLWHEKLREVMVPLDIPLSEYAFYRYVMECIYEAGRTHGKNDIQNSLKKLLDIK